MSHSCEKGGIAVLEKAADERVHAAPQRFINQHPDFTGAQVVSLDAQILGVERQYLAARHCQINRCSNEI
jgi:hypothetical protein